MTARLATIAEAAAIARIYDQGIEERIAAFETEPRTPEQIEAQLVEKGDRCPTMRRPGVSFLAPTPRQGARGANPSSARCPE